MHSIDLLDQTIDIESQAKPTSPTTKRKRTRKRAGKNERIRLKKNGITCKDCGHLFLNESKLQTHVNLVHLNLKPFQCKKCNESFSLKAMLHSHEKSVHSELEWFKCKNCNAIFANRSKLMIDVIELCYLCKIRGIYVKQN